MSHRKGAKPLSACDSKPRRKHSRRAVDARSTPGRPTVVPFANKRTKGTEQRLLHKAAAGLVAKAFGGRVRLGEAFSVRGLLGGGVRRVLGSGSHARV